MNAETSTPGLIKVCFLLQDTGHIYGAQRATLDLLEGLAADEQCEPHVILFQELRVAGSHDAYLEAIRDLGIPCITPPVAQAYSKRLVRTVQDYMTVQGIRVIHTVGYKADLHAWRASQGGKRFKVVSTVHGWFFLPDWKEKLYYHLNLWTLRRVARVIVLSRYYESMLRDKGLKVQRIPSGFRGLPKIPHESEYAAGIISRFTGEKNIPLFIRAVKRLRNNHPAYRFLIAGDGPDREALEHLVRDEGLEDAIDLPGFLPRESFFSRVQVPVICSNIENLPYTVMEAMAYHLPVVGTMVGGLPDLIDDGATGFLVEKDDDQALAERLETLLEDPESARAFGLAGQKKLERDFAPEQALAAHLEMYRSVLH